MKAGHGWQGPRLAEDRDPEGIKEVFRKRYVVPAGKAVDGRKTKPLENMF